MASTASRIAPFASPPKLTLTKRTTGKTLAPTPMNLPPEILGKIFSDRGLCTKDLFALRCASQKFKAIVDDLTLPQFRVPASGQELPQHGWRAKISDYLRAREQAHTRAVNGQHTRIEFIVGRANCVLFSKSEIMFVVCGNGRVLKADLLSPTSLFTQLAPIGTVSNKESLLAATCSDHSPHLWRLVTEHWPDKIKYLYSCTDSGLVRTRLRGPPTMSEDTFVLPLRNQLVFSSNCDYLVEQSEHLIRRFFLGDSLRPAECVTAIPSEKMTALCPRTGRRFVFRQNHLQLPTVRIFADAWCSQVERELTLAHRMDEPFGLNISPDGKKFGVVLYRNNRGSFSYGNYLKLYTYNIVENPVQYISPAFQQTSNYDERVNFTAEVYWAEHPEEGWQLMRRQLMQTRCIDHNPHWFYGIQDASRKANLFSPRRHTTRLVLMSSFPRDADANFLSVPSRARWLQYQVDQAVSYLNPDLMDLCALFSKFIAILLLSCSVNEVFLVEKKRSSFCLFVGMGFCFFVLLVAADARLKYLTAEANRAHTRTNHPLIDLQTASVPGAA